MTTTPELFALRDVCARLDGAGIDYMLTGSLAMSYYARPRMTRDIDLVIALAASDTERLIEGYKAAAGGPAGSDLSRPVGRAAGPGPIAQGR